MATTQDISALSATNAKSVAVYTTKSNATANLSTLIQTPIRSLNDLAQQTKTQLIKKTNPDFNKGFKIESMT